MKANAHSFEGSLTLDRTEYHVGAENPMVGKDVKLNFAIEAYPKK
jgi:polyisoprenoid-binding protein YceI